MQQTDWRWMVSRPEYCLTLGFGAGLSRWAPGTLGTLLGFPLYELLNLPGIPGLVPLGLSIAFLLGIRWCEQIGRILGEADHPAIVWDEVVAMAAVLAFTPPSWPWLLTAFVVFRFFDIIKPWPIRYIDRNMKHGLGVMLDDALAALFSIGVIQLALRVLSG